MDNEKQIVLFLKSGTTFNELQIAAKINERHPSLDSPITIPYDENNPNNPLFIFNKGKISSIIIPDLSGETVGGD